MNNTKHGGPAFPSPEFAVPADMREEQIMKLRNMLGMTLRDYFAAKAMQTIHAEALALIRTGYEPGAGWELKMATNAYSFADAMLKARCAT